ncbi:GNAT family N-acetyltransferase [Halobacillus salinarum]|uniref:GNAT family N-acetyltransferase n=1 Tax=Halobacillus salinarum TaxID=2932257 RepID=A0ABY4EMR9_9BACI|nr:GNAT family N-acetyltransferase [Halobacillus salinarum]UOQ43406.1 GNAT family N-acetyltransferase [Halobacillus salinarum]
MKIFVAEQPDQKTDAFLVRRLVFIEEQKVPEDLEHDEYDKDAVHLVGYENGRPVAAARIRFAGDYGKLERICVLVEKRGLSYGKQMIQFMEEVIHNQNYSLVKLNAQTHAESFYKSLDYKTVSEPFMDAGIPHVAMLKTMT